MDLHLLNISCNSQVELQESSGDSQTHRLAAYPFDGCLGDVVALCLGNPVINVGRAGGIALPGKEPEHPDGAEDVEDRGPLQGCHHVGRQG